MDSHREVWWPGSGLNIRHVACPSVATKLSLRPVKLAGAKTQGPAYALATKLALRPGKPVGGEEDSLSCPAIRHLNDAAPSDRVAHPPPRACPAGRKV